MTAAEVKQSSKPVSVNHLLGVEIISGDMEGNFKKLLKFFELDSEDDVAELAKGFSIIVKGDLNYTRNGAGKYKSMLLLLALASSWGNDNFTLSDANKALIRAYFPPELVEEALSNKDTSHPTIRQLLAEGEVKVTIQRH